MRRYVTLLVLFLVCYVIFWLFSLLCFDVSVDSGCGSRRYLSIPSMNAKALHQVTRISLRYKKPNDIALEPAKATTIVKMSNKHSKQANKRKPLILLYHKLHGSPLWWFQGTDDDFRSCPLSCQVTANRSLYTQADMVMFECPKSILSQPGQHIRLRYYRDEGEWPSKRGNSKQVRMFFAREPQTAVLSGAQLQFSRSMFNYTTSFQRNADIFYPYGHTELKRAADDLKTDFGAGRSKLVLWFVSNCRPKERMEYKRKLQQFIPVDMFGKCNKMHGDPCNRDAGCLRKMKNQYKFYLAFENSFCKDYITEKFWRALKEGMVPIAMGAPKEDYEGVAPPRSFIHVDDFNSPRQLAEYLLLLDSNSTLYNEYHKWRETHHIRWNSANCEICRFATEKPHKVADIVNLWNAHTQCK